MNLIEPYHKININNQYGSGSGSILKTIFNLILILCLICSIITCFYNFINAGISGVSINCSSIISILLILSSNNS